MNIRRVRILRATAILRSHIRSNHDACRQQQAIHCGRSYKFLSCVGTLHLQLCLPLPILIEYSDRWVAGALDSAWRAVDQYLAINELETKREEMHEKWGSSEYWEENQIEDHIRLGMYHSMNNSIPPEKRQ